MPEACTRPTSSYAKKATLTSFVEAPADVKHWRRVGGEEEPPASYGIGRGEDTAEPVSDAVVRRTGVEPVWIVRLSDCRRRSSPGALNGFIRRLRSSPWPIIVPPRVCWHSRLCGVAALTPWGDDACLRMDSNHVLRLFRPMLCRLSYKGVAGIPSSDPPAGAVRTASVLADGRRLDDGGREDGLDFTIGAEDKRACRSSLWACRAFGRKPPCRAARTVSPRFQCDC